MIQKEVHEDEKLLGIIKKWQEDVKLVPSFEL